VLRSMSKRKRLSGILTPPSWLIPSTKSNPPPMAEPSASTGPSLADLGPILKDLLEPGRLNESETRERLGRVKELGAKYGCVQVAREIRDTVERMPAATSEGVEYRKNRGFELACDLTLQHARQRLRSNAPAEALTEVVAVAEEVLECLFAPGKHLKGIELNIDLMDSVLHQVSVGEGNCDDYLRTAQEIATKTLERSLSADEAARGVKSAELDDDLDLDSSGPSGIPADALAYLATVCERMRGARRRMSGVERISEPTARLRFMGAVSEEAAAANVWGLAVSALAASAAMMRERNPNESAMLLKRAKAVCDRAAEEADNAGLKFLAQRYRQRGTQLGV